MYKIGFDAKRLFHNGTGLGNYSRSLVRSLYENYAQNEYVLFSPSVSYNEESYFFIEKFKVVCPSAFTKIGWRSRFILNDLLEENIDIYHGLSHELPFGIENTDIKKVVTIHDLIYKFFPNDFPLLDKKVYDVKWKNACKYADAIIATSEATKLDIIEYFDVPTEKIHVVYQTCSSIFEEKIDVTFKNQVLQKFGLPSSYFLFVGSITDRKNVLNLVKAYSAISTKVTIPLVIVGNGRDQVQKINEFCNKNSLTGRVIILTNVANAELPAIYESAKAFIYPSKYEGFGIPLVEAFKKGIPIITSNVSCMPEVVGDAGLLISPNEIESISNAMLQLYENEDLCNELIENGTKRAELFTLKSFAYQTNEVYKKVL